MHDMIRVSRTAQKFREGIIEYFLLGCAAFSIVVTVLISFFLIKGALQFFTLEDGQAMSYEAIWDRVTYFFIGESWSAGFEGGFYGILPLLTSTLLVSIVAGALAIPIGLLTAIYLSEYAHPRVRGFAKPTLELLAGIPTVVYGFFALQVITPWLSDASGGWVQRPYNLLSAGIVVGIMIIPMVASLSEDALRAVPRSLRDGAIALGANKFESSVKVVLPAALSGVMASFILAISRAIGETMAVALAAGETANFDWNFVEMLKQAGMTMTSFIVRMAKGDVPVGTTPYNSLFAVGFLLFAITLSMNILAQRIIRRYRQVYQ